MSTDTDDVDLALTRRRELANRRRTRNLTIAASLIVSVPVLTASVVLATVTIRTKTVAAKTEPTRPARSEREEPRRGGPSATSTKKAADKSPKVSPPVHESEPNRGGPNPNEQMPPKPEGNNPRGEPDPGKAEDIRIPEGPIIHQYEPFEPKPIKATTTGYYTKTISGFTVNISKMAYENSDKMNGQPLGCIKREIERIVEIFPIRHKKQLSTVPLWVEWDHVTARTPNTLAVYYGGRGEGLYWSGIDPRKSKSITVISLKQTYATKARGFPKTILLHELAHAVHDQLLSFDNRFISNAYDQAMTRGLYKNVKHHNGSKRTGYAASNEAEYFAEVSCCYLDEIDYTPNNSDGLREYDSVAYEIMEKVWGTKEAIKAEKERDSNRKR